MWTALTTNVAETSETHADAHLRGRTYGIPFEDVWSAAQALAAVGMRGWRVVSADDEAGVIAIEAKPLLGRKIDDVTVRVSLDRNGQTRVDARSAARTGRGDMGRGARGLKRFFRKLDRAVVEARQRRLESRRAPGQRPAGPRKDAARSESGQGSA